MIKVVFKTKREYNLGVRYDITDCPKGMVFVVSEKLKMFRVFEYRSTADTFIKNHSSEEWKKVGTAKFAAWEYPNTFFHKYHSETSPNKARSTSVNVLFSEEGYNLVKMHAGKGNMAAWIRDIIAEKLNVKPTDLFANGKERKTIPKD